MKTLKLNLHSVVDVITNSSTEIFTFAHKSGIENIENLFKNMIKAFDSNVKYTDIVKHIYIVPEDSDRTLGMVFKFIHENIVYGVNKDGLLQLRPTDNTSEDYMNLVKTLFDTLDQDLITLLEDEDDFMELGYSVRSWARNKGLSEKALLDRINIYSLSKVYPNIFEYILDSIDAYNTVNYDYSMSTTYEIVLNDEKYEKLVSSIMNIMNHSYEMTAQYC